MLAMARAAWIPFALLALVACGSGDDDEPTPDGGPPPPAEATQLLSVSPADGADPVSVRAELVLTFDGVIDPSAAGAGLALTRLGPLEGGAVSLADRNSYRDPGPVTATVEVSADRTQLVLRARQLLDSDTDYGWAIAGVPLPSGGSIGPFSGGFRTYRNSPVLYISGTATDGDWRFRDTWTYDASHYPLSLLTESVGVDGVRGSPDDWASLERYETDAAGRVTHVDHINPGPDGVFDTSDDSVSWTETYRFSEQGHRLGRYIPGFPVDHSSIRYDGEGRPIARVRHTGEAGPDGEWLTDDDPISSYESYRYEAGRFAVATCGHNDPGPDALWFTADDERQWCEEAPDGDQGNPTVVEWHQAPTGESDITPWLNARESYTYDDDGRVVQLHRSDDPGLDGAWRTDDDVTTWAESFEHDAEGRLTREVSIVGAGADGIPFSADDDISGYRTIEYTDTPEGHEELETAYIDPGLDGVWLTSDDRHGNRKVRRYAPRGNLLLEVEVNRNGFYIGFQTFTRDEYGAELRHTVYDGFGPDGAWGTEDDVIAYYTDRTYDDEGNLASFAMHLEPGPDDEWLTDDDPARYVYKYETDW